MNKAIFTKEITNDNDETKTIEVEIHESNIPALINTRSINTEFRVYQDGTISVESGLHSAEDCVYVIENVETDTLNALGYEIILDENGDETEELEFKGTFRDFMYCLNN